MFLVKLFEESRKSILIEFIMCAAGAIIAAFAIEEMLVPCTILDGGVVGIAMMINAITGFPLGILTVVFNIPFLVIGTKKLGLKFLIKAVYSMIIFSVFLEIFSPIESFAQEPLLAVCFGGIILGIGVGLVIRGGGCLDGTETVAILLNKRFKFPVGTVVLCFNIVIYAVAGMLLGWARAMYSLLTYFITSKVLDVVESGLEQAKAAMIITNEPKIVAEEIYRKLGRTVTIMEGEGLVSGKKTVLYCVMTRMEVYTLKNIVKNIDTSSFVAISDVSEIIGTHIKKVDEKMLVERKIDGK